MAWLFVGVDFVLSKLAQKAQFVARQASSIFVSTPTSYCCIPGDPKDNIFVINLPRRSAPCYLALRDGATRSASYISCAEQTQCFLKAKSRRARST
eukprot:1627548-Amphidinium_carterae.4